MGTEGIGCWGSQGRLPVINPGAEVTPESAEFRLCPVPIVEASESLPAPALRAPPFPAPAPQTRERGERI